MAPAVKFFPPQNFEEWKRRASALKIRQNSVHTREKIWESGSKATEKTILLLRAYWIPVEKDNIVNELGLSEQYKDAQEWLDGFEEFKLFLNAIQTTPHPSTTRDCGIFGHSYNLHHEVCAILNSSPKVTNQGFWGSNEDSVNSFLVSFLSDILQHYPGIQVRCMSRRANYKFKLREPKETKKQKSTESDTKSTKKPKGTLECQIDGLIILPPTWQTIVILEGKPKKRDRHEPQVSRQETYELICALMDETPKGLPLKQAILISQDGMEAYISRANMTEAYRNYLRDQAKSPQDNDFFKVHHYGPWNMKNAKDVKEFSSVVVAICLKAQEKEVD